MPIFELQGPDGKSYEVDAPDMRAAAEAFGGMAPRQPGSDLSIRDVATAASRGVPVLGGLVDNAIAGGQAALGYGDYAGNLKAEQERNARFDREHPWVSGGAQIAGGIAGTIPLIMAAPAAFGAGAGGLAARMGMSALSGAALGGADQAVRSGGDLKDTGVGAGMGAIFGAAAPAVGAAGSRAWNTAEEYLSRPNNALTGINPAAVRFATESLSPGRLATMRQELDNLGPLGMLADVAPEWQGVARGAAGRPGQRDAILEPLLERGSAKNQRLGADIDAAIGPAPVPSRVDAQIAGGQQSLGPRYGDAFTEGMAVDTQHIAEGLDGIASILRGPAQAAVTRVRGMLNVPGTNVLDPHPSALFQTRQAIDGLMAAETNPQVVRQLTMARQQVDDALAQAVPGIKDIDGQFAELARQREGLQRGSQVLDSGKTAIRPQELAQEFPAAAVPQGNMVGPSGVPFRMQQGTRGEIDRIVGQNANDPAALQQALKSEGDWNRDKLRTVFGPAADDVLKAVDRETTFYRTANRISSGSDTDMSKRFGDFLDAAAKPNDVPTDMSVLGGAARGVQKVARALMASDADRKAGKFAADLGQLAVAQGSSRDAVVQALAEAIQRQQARLPRSEGVDKVARALMAAGGLQVERAFGSR
ncbi:hypothetical protein [Xanthobacter autotrophicus]|uniref:hypothetical protein n=1 Tax=Xanthobacter autotrophicus TaxID=280 RepID=UPI0037287856